MLISLSSDKYEKQCRVWGGGIRGNKSADMLRKGANLKAAGQTMTVAAAKKLYYSLCVLLSGWKICNTMLSES
jgi:hypothetical protein